MSTPLSSAEAATITFTMPDRLYHYRVKQLCAKPAIGIVFRMAGMVYRCEGETDNEKLKSAVDQLSKLLTGGEVNDLQQTGITMTIQQEDH